MTRHTCRSALLFVGILCSLVLAVVIGWFLSSTRDHLAVWVLVLFLVGMIAGLARLSMSWLNETIEIEEGCWRVRSWNGKVRSFYCSDFESTGLDGDGDLFDGFVIAMKDGARVRIPRYFNGYQQLKDAARRHIALKE